AWLAALFLAVLSWAGGVASWSLALRLDAAVIFAVGTVLPGTLRWPYLVVLLLFHLSLRLCDRVVRGITSFVASRQNVDSRPQPFQEQHDRQRATGSDG